MAHHHYLTAFFVPVVFILVDKVECEYLIFVRSVVCVPFVADVVR